MNSEEYKANVAAMKAVVDDLHRVSDEIEQGGEIQAREKHTGRGKLLPRERIRRLLAPGSHFLELSKFAGY